MRHFSSEQARWLKKNGFRVLKTKAEKPFGDGRHQIGIYVRKDCSSFTNWKDECQVQVYKQIWNWKTGGHYSLGKVCRLPIDASSKQLKKAVDEIQKGKQTLFSELTKAFKGR